MAFIFGIIAIGGIVTIGVFIYAAGGWGAVIGVVVGLFLLLLLVVWLKRESIDKSVRQDQFEEASKAHAKQTWVQASQRNKTVGCKSCGKKVAELSVVCPDCGEPLPGLKIHCPKCSSPHINISRKGFNVGQAAAGGILVGTVGLTAGMVGAKDSEFVCLGCNYKWKL